MITTADVERWARALGTIMHEDDIEYDVDPLTAALILLGHARGLRVDVGKCRQCPLILQFSTREAAREWCSQGKGEFQKCIAAMPPAWSPTTPPKKGRRRWRDEPRPWWGIWLGGHWATCGELACSGCTVDGRTTGRHTLTWEAAIIAAMPRKLDETDRDFLFGTTRPLPDRVALGGSGEMISTTHRPGDATIREALRVMAHTIAAPEHIAVTHDWCESGKALSNFNGEPQGGLGEMVTAWLRGELDHYEPELRRSLDALTAAATSQQRSAAAPAA